MMLSRRIPSASPGARGSFTRNPSSSGPRCPIADAIRRARASASLLRVKKATPQIPHTLLFSFRCAEERGPGLREVRAQMKARNFQLAVPIPGKRFPHEQKEKGSADERTQRKKRFAFEQQAPVERFIPTYVR